jgi:menaquinone-dependent protoporphyrinogen oxidase
MKIAILFGTKYGTTEKAAELISEKISRLVDNKDINKEDNESIDAKLINLKEKNDILLDFDVFIIGSSVYMGGIRKEVKNFIRKYKDFLIEKQTALFICGCNDDGIKQINKTFPPEIVDNAIATAFLGGELNIDKMNFFDKKIAQLIIKGADEFKIDDVSIDEFVEKIKLSV